jgi:hypothetical protein
LLFPLGTARSGLRLQDMEYEIESEIVLFDESTNPSLERGPHRRHLSRRDRQAELIPEEEQAA